MKTRKPRLVVAAAAALLDRLQSVQSQYHTLILLSDSEQVAGQVPLLLTNRVRADCGSRVGSRCVHAFSTDQLSCLADIPVDVADISEFGIVFVQVGDLDDAAVTLLSQLIQFSQQYIQYISSQQEHDKFEFTVLASHRAFQSFLKRGMHNHFAVRLDTQRNTTLATRLILSNARSFCNKDRLDAKLILLRYFIRKAEYRKYIVFVSFDQLSAVQELLKKEIIPFHTIGPDSSAVFQISTTKAFISSRNVKVLVLTDCNYALCQLTDTGSHFCTILMNQLRARQLLAKEFLCSGLSDVVQLSVDDMETEPGLVYRDCFVSPNACLCGPETLQWVQYQKYGDTINKMLSHYGIIANESQPPIMYTTNWEILGLSGCLRRHVQKNVTKLQFRALRQVLTNSRQFYIDCTEIGISRLFTDKNIVYGGNGVDIANVNYLMVLAASDAIIRAKNVYYVGFHNILEQFGDAVSFVELKSTSRGKNIVIRLIDTVPARSLVIMNLMACKTSSTAYTHVEELLRSQKKWATDVALLVAV